MAMPEERTAQAIATAVDLDQLNAGQLVDLTAALEDAIAAMANYGGSSDSIHIIASLLAETTVAKMVSFRRDEAARSNSSEAA